VIEKIAAATLTKEGQAIVPERRPAVFVDRDGTINEHIEYLSEPGRFRELPGSFAALQKMRQLGYRIIVVTNQPGIGLGYFTKEDFYAVNREMLRQATAAGCSIDRIYFCPHSKSDNCKCRKPSPYLLQRAAAECNVDLSRSFMIGDMTSDIQLAVNAGCKGILVKTGRGGDDGLFSVHADAEVQDLADAVAVIAAQGPVVLEPGSPIARSSRVVVGEHVEPSNTAGRSSAELWGAVLGCAALIDQKTRDTSGRSPIETTLTLLRKAVGRGIALSKAAQEGSSARICAEVVRDVVLEAHGASCEVEVCCVKDATKISGQVSLADLMVEMVENLLEGRHDETAPYVAIHIDVVAVGTEGKKLELKPGSYARISFSDTRGAPAQMVDEELFNPFLSQRLRSAGRGLGATLASARSVLKGEGGSVSLATRVDRGITVSLYMPSA
jgi:histidinol-phosphate phosphatase family protein